jgi:hypothetical protein
MKKIIFFLALPLFLLNLSVITPVSPAQAAGALDIQNQQGFENGSGEVSQVFGNAVDPRDIIVNVIVGILGFLGIIFMVLILSAGFRYMTSMGNEEQTSKAKEQIVSAVIGLVIILAAYILTSFVFSCLVGATTAHEWTTNICSQ